MSETSALADATEVVPAESSGLSTAQRPSDYFDQFVLEPIHISEREPAPPLPSGSIACDKVPPMMRPQPLPLIRIIMPLVMVLMVGGMLALMLTSGEGQASPMMLMFPIMLVVSMMTMFGGGQVDDTDEIRRGYLRHLGAVREEALAAAAQQRAHELHKHPDPQYLWSVVGSSRMWERGASDPDALEIRLGVGATALLTPVTVADSGATEDLDPVCAVALRHTVRSVGAVAEMPVAVQLQAFRFIGLAGPCAPELARAAVLQLVFHHGPETVGIKIIGQGCEWAKWLPHTQSPEEAVFKILLVNATPTTGIEEFIDDPTWNVIIDVDARIHTALGTRALSEGLMLTAAEKLTVHTEGGLEDIGVPDAVSAGTALQCARAMSAYRRPRGAGATRRDFLALVGIEDATSVQPEQLWAARRVQRDRLRVPIGVTAAGTPQILDIKEAAHGGVGPHGLCIGATGSGKSELLKTFVLALAITHSPEELNFVLVDFKGGATFLGLEDLPHTSAVITNLAEEASLVERMHDAISGEMNRRQEVLRAAGNFANVHEYNEARATTHSHLAPLPALVIVLDEFSELLGQHPDFADLFVAVGRLGRSLHMHLLLASQRLEEGRLRGLDSHLSYRIGLKTFSAAESRQVLGVTDAYQLPAQPGAGYVKSDHDDVTRFQGSYVSGPLPVPVDKHSETAEVRLFQGWHRDDAGETEIAEHSDLTVLSALVELAVAAGKQRRLQAHQLWLPPLPESIPLAGVADEVGELRAVVGVIDRPYLQRQDPCTVDFSGAGGHLALCGGPQTGKTTAMRSIVLSLAATHPTERIRFYILDLAGTALAGLAAVPHVAGVAHKADKEKVRRVVDEVLGLIENPEPRDTFVVVDGWHVIASDYEDLGDSFATIAAEGLAARVHLIIATPRWTAVRPAIRDLIGTRMELRLGEPMDSVIDRKKQQKLVSAPGRGLTPAGEELLFALSTNQDAGHVILASQKHGWQPVPRLKMLPAALTLDSLPVSEAPGLAFAIGGRQLTTLTWDYLTCPNLLIIGAGSSGKSTALSTIGAQISRLGREYARLVVVDTRRTHLAEFDPQMVAAYAATAEDISATIANTVTTLRGRLPGADITPQQLKQRNWWSGPELFVLIDDADLLPDGALQPLRELIPHARDIGLHVVLARKAGGVNRAMFDPVLSALRDSGPAVLLLDADSEEGKIFGIRPTQQPPGRGTWQVRGTTLGACQVAQVGSGSE
ncbi:type VII secretion protein EccCa [Staphylococcus chromogenes]|nr:type VII secretion protein EccCa [Staphylococcus chromogenes]